MCTYGHPGLGVLIAFCPTHNVQILPLKSHSLPPHFLIAACTVCCACLVVYCCICTHFSLHGIKMEITDKVSIHANSVGMFTYLAVHPFVCFHTVCISLKLSTGKKFPQPHNSQCKYPEILQDNYMYISNNDLKWLSSEPWWNEKHSPSRTASCAKPKIIKPAYITLNLCHTPLLQARIYCEMKKCTAC